MFKDITFVYTTAPRGEDTLNESIRSLRKAGIKNKIYISAEPWKYNIKDKNVKITIHKKRKWCFLHYDWVLNNKEYLKTKYLFIIQDDFVFSDRIKELNKFNDEWFGFYDFYLSDQIFPFINKVWRNDVRFGWSTAWACFLFDTKVLPKIINSYFYQNHKNDYVIRVKNQQVDSCIWESCKLLNLRTYFTSLSYCKHIWESVIWHTDPYFWKFNFAQCEIGEYKEQKEKIVVWIASIPEREEQLKNTINSLYGQVDKIIVWLNGYKWIPQRLRKMKKCKVVPSDNSKWDAMKFCMVDKVNGYYFACDDDLIYPEDYVKIMINKIEDNKRLAIVWLHWVIIHWKISSYYYDCQRFHFSMDMIRAKQVNILGTGTIAFHTDTIKLSIDDFKLSNMADIWLWIKAQELKVPMVCIERPKNMITQQKVDGSIWELHKDSDMTQTELCNSVEWKMF